MGKRNASPRRTPRPAQAPPARSQPPTPFDRELTTKRRGEISELAFALAAARHGFGISKPFGDSERYDIILDPGHVLPVIPTEAERQRAQWRDLLFPSTRPRLIRVQVKSTNSLLFGLYHVGLQRKLNGRVVRYELSEIDFVAAYVIPEDSWFLFPFPHILGRTALLLNPKRRRKPHPYDSYREAWHYLYEPDGLEFA
jgi:hypothetical protein